MIEFTEEFSTIATKVLADAKRAGITMVAHTMTCPNCVRMHDADMTVIMCGEAKTLNKIYRDSFEIAKPYMQLIEAAAAEQQ